MRPLRLIILAFYLGGAVLLFAGHLFDDLRIALISDLPTIRAVHDDTHVTVWEPSYKKLELQVLPPDRSRSSGPGELSDIYVRPAWGMFAATVGLFFYLWTNFEHGCVVFSLF